MEKQTALQIIVLIFSFILLFVIIVIALRRWIRSSYFKRLDRERVRLKPIVQKFLKKESNFNSEELKYRYNTVSWEAVEHLLLSEKQSADDENKIRISKLFEELGYPAFYQQRLKTGNRYKRAEAAEKLGRIGSTKATSNLIETLKDSSKDVRSIALRSLAMIGDHRAHPYLIEKLSQIESEKGAVFIPILKDVFVSLGESIVPLILSKMGGYDIKTLSIVIEILGEIGSKKPVSILISHLEHNNPEIRAKAARALGKIRDISSVPNLLKMEKENVWFVRLQICRALGSIGDPKGIDFLTKMLVDENWQVRAASAESLRMIGSLAFSVLATTLIESPDRYAKEQVAEEMQRSGIIDEVINHLDDSQEHERELSKKLLNSLAVLGITSLMKKAHGTHPSKKVRLEVETILNSVEKRP